MALGQQDIELIEARAELIAERVVEKVTEKLLQNHIDTCPHGRMIMKSKFLAIGSVLGAGIGGGIGGGGIVAILMKVF